MTSSDHETRRQSGAGWTKWCAAALLGGVLTLGAIPQYPRANAQTSAATVFVRQFGVRSDGSDAHDAIQAAIASAIAHGIRDISFAGVDAATSTVTLDNVHGLHLIGDGGKLRKVAGSGSNSMIFNLKGGCSDIEISGFADLDGGYDSTHKSSGYNPIILIGDQTGRGDKGARNVHITIRDNALRRGNWAAILVYGRSDNTGKLRPLNQDILIERNNIRDVGGSGVFIYKNAVNVIVRQNTIADVGGDGIVFDTKAASDSIVHSEPIDQVEASGNTIRNFGLTTQGVGILMKGAVTNANVRDNDIADAAPHTPGMLGYGIIAIKDSNPIPTAPSQITIAGNNVHNILGQAGGICLLLGRGVRSAATTGNSIAGCQTSGLTDLSDRAAAQTPAP